MRSLCLLLICIIVSFHSYSLSQTHYLDITREDFEEHGLDLEPVLDLPWVIISGPPSYKLDSYQFFDPMTGWASFFEEIHKYSRYQDGEWKFYEAGAPNTRSLHPIFCLGENSTWTTCATNIPFKENLLYFDGSKWNEVQTPNSAGIRDIWFNSEKCGWMAAEWGQILRFDGRTWKHIYCPVFSHIDNIVMQNENLGWAITDSPYTVLEYREGAWSANIEEGDHFIPEFWSFLTDKRNANHKIENNELDHIFKDYYASTVQTDTIEVLFDIFHHSLIWSHKECITVYKYIIVTINSETFELENQFVLTNRNIESQFGIKNTTFIVHAGDTYRIIVIRANRQSRKAVDPYQLDVLEGNVRMAHGICIADLSGDGIEDRYTVVTGMLNRYALTGINDITGYKDINEEAGLLDPTRTEDGRVNYDEGASCADIDNDGDQDLFITSLYGANILFKQVRKGFFKERSKQLRVNRDCGRSNSGIWADVNCDGFIDLYISNEDSANILYLNNGAGFFTDVTEESGLMIDRGGGGSAFGDIDGDGDLDLFVPRRGLRNLLYVNMPKEKNSGTPRFIEAGIESGLAGADKISHSTSSVFVDVDNDMDLDLFVTNLTTTNWLYRNDGQGHFTDITSSSGLTDSNFSQTAIFWDTDHDGDLDLFIGNRGESQFMINSGKGRFINRPDALNKSIQGYVSGLASGDLDLDGDLDLYVSLNKEPNIIIENTQDDNCYLQLSIRGTISNRDGVGARVYLYEAGCAGDSSKCLAMREVKGGNGFNSMSSRIQHFGVPEGGARDLVVHFPSGVIRTLTGVIPDQMIRVTEEEGWPGRWSLFKKGVRRIVYSPVHQTEFVYIVMFIAIIGIVQAIYSRQQWWQNSTLIFSGLIPLVVFFILLSSLRYTEPVFRHAFPVIFGLLLAGSGIIFGKTVLARKKMQCEYIEQLYFATTSFFHGEWGAKKLNRLGLYFANLPGRDLSQDMKERFGEAVRDYYGLIVPEIEKIAGLLRAAGLKREWAQEIKAQALDLSSIINKINVSIRIAPAIYEKTTTEAIAGIESLRDKLFTVRKSVSGEFTTDVCDVLKNLKQEYRSDSLVYQESEQKQLYARIRYPELHQIVDNAVNNALRAAPGRLVVIQVFSSEDYITVNVEDEGPGVPPHILKTLFYQQKTTSQNQGGFGLYYARVLLEKYGGTIKYLREHDRTIFQIKMKRTEYAE